MVDGCVYKVADTDICCTASPACLQFNVTGKLHQTQPSTISASVCSLFEESNLPAAPTWMAKGMNQAFSA